MVVVVVSPAMVVVVVVGPPAVTSLTTSCTKLSTVVSMVPAATVVLQSALPTAFPYAVENLPSALLRQVLSTGWPLLTAFAWHLSLPPAFLPAALSSPALHLLAVGVPVPPLISVTRSLMKLSTFVSMVPASTVVWQSALPTAFPYAVENLPSTLLRQVLSTARPLEVAFDQHFTLPPALLLAALISP